MRSVAAAVSSALTGTVAAANQSATPIIQALTRTVIIICPSDRYAIQFRRRMPRTGSACSGSSGQWWRGYRPRMSLRTST